MNYPHGQYTAVPPKEAEASVSAGKLVYSFPPASVVRLTCELA